MAESAKNLPEDRELDTNIDYTPKCIPIEKIIKYRKQGLSLSEIGSILGISKQAVSQRLQPFADDIANLEAYKEHRADILALKGRQVMKYLDDDRLQKSSAYQLAGMFGILYDKERLERGQTSVNVGYADFSKDVKELDAEIQALDAELGECQDTTSGEGDNG